MSRKILHQDIIKIDTHRIPYLIIRNSRARHIRLLFKSNHHFEVVLPQKTPIEYAKTILRKHRDWIRKRWMRHLEIEKNPLYPDFRDEGHIPFHGKRLKLAVDSNSDILSIRRKDNVLFMAVPKSDSHLVPNLVFLWLRHQAEKEIRNRGQELIRALGIRILKLSIRNQKARWGSCSGKSKIALNWRLILVPEWVMDYVIIHELCHIKKRDHSPAFWGHVSRYCDRIGEARKWLLEYRWLLALGYDMFRHRGA